MRNNSGSSAVRVEPKRDKYGRFRSLTREEKKQRKAEREFFSFGREQRWILTTSDLRPRKGSRKEWNLLDRMTGELYPVSHHAPGSASSTLVKKWDPVLAARINSYLAQFVGDQAVLYMDYAPVRIGERGDSRRSHRGEPRLVVPRQGVYGQAWIYGDGAPRAMNLWSWKLNRVDIIRSETLANRVGLSRRPATGSHTKAKKSTFHLQGKTIGECLAGVKVDVPWRPGTQWRVIGAVTFAGGKHADIPSVVFDIRTTPRNLKGDVTKAIVGKLRADGWTFTSPLQCGRRKGVRYMGAEGISLEIGVVSAKVSTKTSKRRRK